MAVVARGELDPDAFLPNPGPVLDIAAGLPSFGVALIRADARDYFCSALVSRSHYWMTIAEDAFPMVFGEHAFLLGPILSSDTPALRVAHPTAEDVASARDDFDAMMDVRPVRLPPLPED
jgi:hypothetical protein